MTYDDLINLEPGTLMICDVDFHRIIVTVFIVTMSKHKGHSKMTGFIIERRKHDEKITWNSGLAQFSSWSIYRSYIWANRVVTVLSPIET